MNTNLYVPLVNKCADDDLSFGVVQIHEASEQAKRDPLLLTDEQLSIIATYAYADAQVYARQRAEARAKAAAPPVPAPSRPSSAPVPGPPVARLPRLPQEGDLSTPERMEQWVSKNEMAAVPLVLWEGFVKANREKRELLEARVQRLESMLIVQTNQLQNIQDETHNLKSTTRGLTWAGEHAAGKSYRAGEFVKRAGSVWLATKDTEASPGSSSGDEWQLIVKGQAYS